MDAELLRELARITPEEEALRAGSTVDRALYATGRAFEVDSARMLERGRLIAIRPHTRFAPFPRHSHNYVEIMYVCSGSVTHVVDGGAPVTVRAGELLFLGMRASHAIRRAEAGDVAVNFIVLPQFFDYAFEMIGTDNVLARFLLGTLQGDVGFLHCRAADLLPVQNVVESMIWSLLRREPNARKTNQVSMGLLFLQILSHPETLSQDQASGSPLVLAALREIEENSREASLTSVAERFGVSAAYLSREVHRATGSTFKELLRQKRLDRAQRLLRDTRLSVQEIIERVGYDNTSYFYRVYREQFGITPKEFRNRLAEK